jgi:hypothetical protein
MKAALWFLDPHRSPPDNFGGLISRLESLLADRSVGDLPDKAHLLHVHSLRNDTQHRAKLPAETDVSDARTYSRDFLNGLLHLVWGLDLDRISVADLIRDADAKVGIKDAEKALLEED